MNSIKEITDIYHVIQDANNELYEVVSSVNSEVKNNLFIIRLNEVNWK
jgi:hypothetical protein